MDKMEVLGIDHIVLRTSNLEAMLLFYAGILSCKLERELPQQGLTQLRAGNALIDLVVVDSPLGMMGGKPPQQNGRNLDHFCLQINACEPQALILFLQERGVEVLPDAIRYGASGFSWSIYVHDPENNVLELKPRH
ncbi:VOC family protein [Vibrio gallicus]|uniref:VOC family protein n=1 Tax=Vibrio gallicus TaxID=190897 RepID=UPI0021C28225|nr:VOC family protein [Vibrio gallicus]